MKSAATLRISLNKEKIMKKIISFILAFMLAVIPMGVAAAGATNSLFERLNQYTPAEREQYFAMLRPFLTSDAGVKAGIDNVGSGMFENMLGTTFTPQQKDTLVRVFKSFSCIDESTGIRLKYADIIQNKVPASVSPATTYGIDKMTKLLYDQSPAAKAVLEGDGYTAAVIANILKIIPEVNGGALMNFEKGIFTVGNLNWEFSNEFDAEWTGYVSENGKTVTAYELAAGMVNFLNWAQDGDRLFIAKSLQSIGVCKVVGEGTVPPTTTVRDNQYYTVLDSMSGVANSIFDSSLVIKTKENIPAVIDISVKSDNPMIYNLVGANILNGVKYSVPTPNGIRAALEPNKVYVIKTAPYPFIDAHGWGKSYIAALYARGIINGKSEAEFMPEAAITREEFVKLVVELFNLVDENAKTDFTDVSEGAWYYKYVASAQKEGIIGGVGDGRFGTGRYIKRQDMAKIINTMLKSRGIELSRGNTAGFKDDAAIAEYAKEHVYAISGHIISGDNLGNFNPNKNATRQEAAKMVYGMLDVYLKNIGS